MSTCGARDVGGEDERQLDLRQRQPLARAAAICSCCSAWRSSRNAAACARSSASRCDTKRSHASRVVEDRAGVGRDRDRAAARSSRSRRRDRARRRRGPRSRTRCRRPRSPASPPAASRASPGSASGSESSSTTSWACLRIGPTRTASSRPRADSRNVTAWPAAGASTIIRSAARASSIDFTLPSTRMSFMPGHRGRDHVERARRRESLRDALHAVRHEVVDERGVGGEEPGPDAGVEIDLVVAERGRAEHRRQARLALDLDDRAPTDRRGRP